MTDAIEQVDQEMLGTIKRHAGLGLALGIGIAIAGVLAIVSPLVAGLSVTIAVGVLLIVSGVSRLFLADVHLRSRRWNGGRPRYRQPST